MTTIQKLLQDPAWWITVVFMGLVVGIIGNLATHVILKRRNNRRAVLLSKAEELARDIGLILDTHLVALSYLVQWGLNFIMMIGFSILLSIWKDHGVLAVFVAVMMLVWGVLAFFSFRSAIYYLDLWNAAQQIYRGRRSA